MSKARTPNLLDVTENYVSGAISLERARGGLLTESEATSDFDEWLREWTRMARDAAFDEAVDVINDAREEGETDLRQVREWVANLKEQA